VPPANPATVHLYAVVPAEEASRLPLRRSFSVLTCGPTAALFGAPRPGANAVRAALSHDRIVGLALAACSSVVPFRLALELASATELDALCRLNSAALADQLARFRGRVEMGLKMRLPAPAADPSSLLRRGLDRVRELAPKPADRCERLGFSPQGGAGGRMFAASYLVPRHAIDDFWRATEGIRRLAPELPLLGSGPWAAYSFCDVPLQLAPVPLRQPLESEA
jgi:hypothetical protein